MDRYHKILKENKDAKYARMYNNFEVFHMLKRQIPVDSVKKSVQVFAWEPVGSKFAVIHGDSQSLNISFYGIKLGENPVMLKKYKGSERHARVHRYERLHQHGRRGALHVH